MKKSKILLAIALIFIVASCRKSDDNNIIVNPVQTRLQQAVDKIYQNYKQKYPDYPGSLTLKVISKKGTFFVVAGDKSITSSTHFRIASNTKSFTSAAILILAQQGKLKITDTITHLIPGTDRSYIPLTPGFNIPYANHITIRELLQHRAGVFDVSNDKIPDTVSVQVPYKGLDYIGWVQGTDPQHTFTFDEMINVASTCRLFYFVPGTSYHYSNTGYSVLGKIIERVSGMSYQQFVTENIINSMGLANTSCPVLGTQRELPVPFATGYIYEGDTMANTTVSNISANVGEGNIISTADDLSRYLRTLLSGTGPLSSYWINEVMLVPMNYSNLNWYACGLEYTNNLGYGHNGAHEGYLSRMVYDPATDFTAVSYTNCWNVGGGIQTIGDQLYHLLDESCFEAKTIVTQ